MALMANAADNAADASEILLNAFRHHRNLGHNIRDSYNHAKTTFPVEFGIVSNRARLLGHQFGVPGETFRSRHELILKGHHCFVQCGVCVGHTGSATCVVLRYPTHNYALPYEEMMVGGSGGLIKEGHRLGVRLLRNQQYTIYNDALHTSLVDHSPIRLYAYHPSEDGMLYRYMGLFRVIYDRIILTPENLVCFEYAMFPLPEQQLPAPDLIGPGPGPGADEQLPWAPNLIGPGPGADEPDEADEAAENLALVALEWHPLPQAHVDWTEIKYWFEIVLWSKSSDTLENKPGMVAGVLSNDSSVQLKATTQFRKFLSIERSLPIQEVIQSGVVPRFIEFLMSAEYPQLQFEAAWALTNIASGTSEHTKVVIDHGAVPLFVQLLGSPSDDVREQAVRALSYLSDGTNDEIQAEIKAGVCSRLVEPLLHPSPSVSIPVLRTVGNIVTGDDWQTQFMINCQALPCLLTLLTFNYEKIIKKEACWIISNITAGNKEQIQSVIEANIIGPLVQLLQNAEFNIKKDAAWALSNATSGGTHEQIKYLVSQGCIRPMCDLLVCPDPRIVKVCLEGLENILKVGESEKNLGQSGEVNLYAQMIDDAEGLDKIENLQSHDNNEIYEKAVKLLGTYWLEEDDETLPAGDVQQQGFNF